MGRSRATRSQTPADLLASGWIAALRRLNPRAAKWSATGRRLSRRGHWTVETLLKLGYTAPDRAYEVGVRIVELSDDPWILETVRVSVFGTCCGATRPFLRSPAADARRLPRLRQTLSRIAPGGLDKVEGARLSQAPS